MLRHCIHEETVLCHKHFLVSNRLKFSKHTNIQYDNICKIQYYTQTENKPKYINLIQMELQQNCGL